MENCGAWREVATQIFRGPGLSPRQPRPRPLAVGRGVETGTFTDADAPRHTAGPIEPEVEPGPEVCAAG
jgi:hypothetical protein